MKKRLLFAVAALILAASMILCSCGGNDITETTTADVSVDSKDSGYEKSFVFEVVDAEGNITRKTIETDGENLGEVLQRLELITGEEGPYGLYIKEINGIVADYDVDGTYWAFYINGEYASTSADQTEITDGYTYTFKVEKG